MLRPGRTRLGRSRSLATGIQEDKGFSNYHRVLSRARWSMGQAARRLFLRLVDRFVPQGPVVIGIDDTIEGRWGSETQTRFIYHDPVRFSKRHFVEASELRWLSVSLLAAVPWAGRVWALPFLRLLCPSERHHQEEGLPPDAWKSRTTASQEKPPLTARQLHDGNLSLN